MTILLFFAILFVLVLVHEFGHFWTAKKTGMRVDEFGIGFPPRLFGWKKGETTYTFNLFPIGGFVQIFGQDAIEAEGSPDRDRSFVGKKKWQQALVLIAGVTANILLAWVLFIAVHALGVLTVVDEAVATPDAQLVISDVLPESAAEMAAIPRGALIDSVTVGDTTLDTLTPTAFADFIENSNDSEFTITYTARGVSAVATATPMLLEGVEQPILGVQLALVEVVQKPFFEAIKTGTIDTFATLWGIIVGVSALIADAFVLNADVSQVTGPVGLVGLVGEASAFGLSSVLMLTALISLSLAVINLLPFPALDGGRLLFVLIETITRKPIKPSIVQGFNTAGFLLLILLMIAVTYQDITRLF